MELFNLLKILSPFIFLGFIFLITLLVVKLFVTKKVFRSTLICVGIFYVSLILILCCTDSGKVGYASLYNFIKTTTKLALNALVIMSANSVQILQGLVNTTLSIFALASFIVLIKQIIIDVEFLELSGAYRITIKEFKFILNHQVIDEKIDNSNFDFLVALNC